MYIRNEHSASQVSVIAIALVSSFSTLLPPKHQYNATLHTTLLMDEGMQQLNTNVLNFSAMQIFKDLMSNSFQHHFLNAIIQNKFLNLL